MFSGLVGRSRVILSEQGIGGLLRAILRFLYWRVRERWPKVLFLFAGSTKTRTVGGISSTFVVEEYPEFERVYDLMGEQEVLEDVLVETYPDDVFYDIGANVGIYSCFVGKKLSDGAVVAFEPHPENLGSLRKNLAQNGVDAIVRETALGADPGTAHLRETGTDAGEGEHAIVGPNADEGIPVPVERLDAAVAEGLPDPTVVKIDVEGAETEVVSGGASTLSDCRLVYCELHPDRMMERGGSPKEILQKFEDLGFDVELLEGRKREYVIVKATRYNS